MLTMTSHEEPGPESELSTIIEVVDDEDGIKASRGDNNNDNINSDVADIEKVASCADSFRHEVVFNMDDPSENLKLMSRLSRWLIALVLISLATLFTALSSTWSICVQQIIAEYHIDRQTAILGVSLYVFALSIGPPILAPLSEFYGRKPVYTMSLIFFIGFQFLVAFSKGIHEALIGRYLCALVGSVFMSNVAGSITDIFDQHEVAAVMNIYTTGIFIGPTLGPLIGGFIVASLSWRWVFYVFLIWSFVAGSLVILVLPETYAPKLLVRKARRLRKETGNNKYFAPLERNHTTVASAMKTNCKRSVMLLLTEPMLTVLCFYAGMLLSIVYFFFVIFPLVYGDMYHFRVQYLGMAYLPVTVGIIIAALTNPFWNNLFEERIKRNNGVRDPENRLPQMCVGACISPVGLLIFAWTTYTKAHWIVPMIGASVFGIGMCLTVNCILMYIVDVYRRYSASAIAANVMVRSAMAGALPLVTHAMADKLGIHWAVTLMACITVLLAPSAFIIYRYGKAIRAKCWILN